jgi:hypothetical protein
VGRINLFPPPIAEILGQVAAEGWPDQAVEIRIEE